MGWSRKPYEFQSPRRSKSKGEATYGAFRKHAFLASKFLPIFFNAKQRVPWSFCERGVRKKINRV
jgi:hypothetical protein